MRSPRMATAPFSITRRCAFSVMTYRALQIQSAGSAASAEAKSKKLQIRNIEWLREQIFQTIRFGLAVQIDQHDFDVAAEFPQNLTAGAARWSKDIRIGRNRGAAELADTLGNGFKHRHALGADGESVGGILHVAAGVNASFGVFDGRAHLKPGIRGEGVGARGNGGCGTGILAHAVPPTWAAALAGNAPAYPAPSRRSPGLRRD